MRRAIFLALALAGCKAETTSNDLSIPGDDLAVASTVDFAGVDLRGVDLRMSVPDMTMSVVDMTTVPPDFFGLDLTGVDLAPPPPDMTIVDMAMPPQDMTAVVKYSVTLTLVNFGLHNTQKFTLWIREPPASAILAMGTMTLDSGASQMIVVPNAVEAGKTYNLDFWVDYNNSNSCDAAGTDHSWRLSTGVIAGNYSTSFTHDTNWTTICP